MAKPNALDPMKHEELMEEIKHCRHSEFVMMNFSIIIFGAVVYFIFSNLQSLPNFQALALIFLIFIIGFIGLYISRVNEIETYAARAIRHHEGTEKNIESLPESRWRFGKEIVFSIYQFLIIFSFLLLSGLVLTRANEVFSSGNREEINSLIFMFVFYFALIVGYIVFYIPFSYNMITATDVKKHFDELQNTK